jgi:3'-phosphoadenosine 5'-phosphosulfate synthase
LTKEEHEHLKGETKIALRCAKVNNGKPIAIIENPVYFDNRKEEISTRTFGTFSVKHPKVERIMAQGDLLVSGSRTRFIHEIKYNDGLD